MKNDHGKSMKTTAPRNGIIAALPTPLDQRGRLLHREVSRHIEFLGQQGVKAVLALGSTGEFARLTPNERTKILTRIIANAGNVPVLCNITAPRLDEAIALGRAARRAGVKGVTLMPPYFYPVAQSDMRDFFIRVAEAVDLPFYLYNYPELTNNVIELETIAAVADRVPLTGIKHSGSNLAFLKPLVRLGNSKGFSVFSGADTRLPYVFGLGVAGCIGGLINFMPELPVAIYRILKDGEAGKTGQAAQLMREAGMIFQQLPFPLSIACGMEARGFEPGVSRMVISAETKRLYHRCLINYRSLFKAAGLRTL